MQKHVFASFIWITKLIQFYMVKFTHYFTAGGRDKNGQTDNDSPCRGWPSISRGARWWPWRARYRLLQTASQSFVQKPCKRAEWAIKNVNWNRALYIPVSLCWFWLDFVKFYVLVLIVATQSVLGFTKAPGYWKLLEMHTSLTACWIQPLVECNVDEVSY